jgi:LysM repeat protein
MYETGYGIRPLRSTRRIRPVGRLAAVVLLALSVSIGLAVAAHGSSAGTGLPSAEETTVVVQPGDTLWSIASQRYPSDDVRARVEDIKRANGLHSPVIEAGETLHLP